MLKTFATLIICFIICSKTSAQNADIDLLKNINVGRNTSLDHTFESISKSTYPISLAVPIGLLGVGFIKKDKDLQRKGLTATVSLVASFGTTYVLKKIVKRDRPYTTYPFIQPAVAETNPSFPSGHTTGAFTTATSLTLAFPKWYVAVPAYAWASSVAYSRLHLGIHYPTDILAGAIIGSGSAWLSYKANRWLQKKSKKN